ncbi:putative lipid II flippase MurJ [Azospirillaceae bacterium]
MSLARAVLTVGGLTVLSRIAGFIRDLLIAAALGAGPVADAFFIALKLPNLLRRLFAEGAFSVAFIPMFTEEIHQHGRDSAERFAMEALGGLLLIVIPFSFFMIAAMPWVVPVLAPGFLGDSVRFPLAVEFARWTFPYLTLVSVVALLGGTLNSLERFAASAAAPVAFNLALIACLTSILLWSWSVGGPIDALTSGCILSYGVTFAGVIQALWMLWAANGAGVRLFWPRLCLTPKVIHLGKLAAPSAVGAGVGQMTLFLSVVLASLLPNGAVSYLYYADRLNQMPLGVVGIAIGTALLPALSREVSAGRIEQARMLVCRGLEAGLLLALPATVALIVAARPIIGGLFERGAFGPEATEATAQTLAAYAIGIPGFIVSKVLSAACFARQDVTGPLRVTVIVTAVNAGLALVLSRFLGHVGIALSAGLAAWVTAGLLALRLRRKELLILDQRLRRRGPRLLASALGMGCVIAWMTQELGMMFQNQRTGALVILVGSGLVVYGGLTFLTGAVRKNDLYEIFKNK